MFLPCPIPLVFTIYVRGVIFFFQLGRENVFYPNHDIAREADLVLDLVLSAGLQDFFYGSVLQWPRSVDL